MEILIKEIPFHEFEQLRSGTYLARWESSLGKRKWITRVIVKERNHTFTQCFDCRNYAFDKIVKRMVNEKTLYVQCMKCGFADILKWRKKYGDNKNITNLKTTTK